MPDADWRLEASAAASAQASPATVRLGDLFHLRTGFACYAEQRELLDRNCAYIHKSGSIFRETAVVQPGEVLFVRVGVGCYGCAAVVPTGLVAQADDWIHILTPKAGVGAQAVADWLNTAGGHAEVRCLAKGVGTLSVSKSSLANLRVPARS